MERRVRVLRIGCVLRRVVVHSGIRMNCYVATSLDLFMLDALETK